MKDHLPVESKCDVQKRFSKELFDCLQVLEEAGVEFWLDCGTLLGAVRDNSFIEWDNDIDFGIFPGQVDRIVALKQEFRNTGFEIEVVSYRGKVQLVHCYRHKPAVNFNVYHDGGEKYWSLWMVAGNGFSRANMRFIHQKSYLGRVYRSTVKVVRSLIPKHVVSRLFRDKMLVIEVPRDFFLSAGRNVFHGTQVLYSGEQGGLPGVSLRRGLADASPGLGVLAR